MLSNFYGHLMSRDKISDNLDAKSDFRFQPLDAVNEALSKFQQELQGRVVTGGANNLAAGMVGIPDSDKSKDITRYTDRVVTKLITRIVKRMRETLNKYVSITITDMTDLIPELTYYIRWAEYIEKLQKRGAAFSKAKVVNSAYQTNADISEEDDSKSRYYMKARGIYNIKLAAFDTEESEHIVTNDLDFDSEHRVYILTGANRGGKTTITQTIGQLLYWLRVVYISQVMNLNLLRWTAYLHISLLTKTRPWILEDLVRSARDSGRYLTVRMIAVSYFSMRHFQPHHLRRAII